MRFEFAQAGSDLGDQHFVEGIVTLRLVEREDAERTVDFGEDVGYMESPSVCSFRHVISSSIAQSLQTVSVLRDRNRARVFSGLRRPYRHNRSAHCRNGKGAR